MTATSWPPKIFYSNNFQGSDIIPLARTVLAGQDPPATPRGVGENTWFLFDCLGGVLQVWLRLLPTNEAQALAQAILDHHEHYRANANSTAPPPLVMWLVQNFAGTRHFTFPGGVMNFDFIDDLRRGDLVLMRVHDPQHHAITGTHGQFLHALIVSQPQSNNCVHRTRAQATDFWDAGHGSGTHFWHGKLKTRVQTVVGEWFGSPDNADIAHWVVHIWILRHDNAPVFSLGKPADRHDFLLSRGDGSEHGHLAWLTSRQARRMSFV